MYFVYIIECGDGSLYTGITTDVARRFQEHKDKLGGNFTRSREVLRVVFTEEHADRSAASIREAEIKRFSRQEKLQLISEANTAD